MMDNQLNWPKDNFENIETAWEGDLWHRRRLGEQLTSYVDRLNCGAVLALDARWGEGKTWFVRNWAKHLDDTQHNVIYLDAFANDYLEDPFLVIASEIASKLDKTAENKPLVYKFKKAAAVMQQGLLTLAPTLIASMISCALTGGLIPLIKIDSEKITDKLDDAIDKVTENIGEKVTEAIQAKIDSYEEEKNSIIAFKATLAQLAENLDKPLVFIIDELDRCRPDFAIRLIERIKHFFDIRKIVFVLVMNKNQLINGIQHIYGYDNESSKIYLEKFIDFEIPLGNQVNILDKNKSNLEVISKLLKLVGEESVDIALVVLLSISKDISTRELKRKINLYALLKKEKLENNIFIALGVIKGARDLLHDMERIAVLIMKMKQGNENVSSLNMAHFNIENFKEIVEKEFNVELLIINDYLEHVSAMEDLRTRYQHNTYEIEYTKFLNKYAFKPSEEMQYHLFQQQYFNYIENSVWLED
ncbi:P-loop NTPase fold protein [Acinetobacter sp.]|uniref:KAP family P-loop NTPase fold protein n=1 Tax=Acinetobacter sp. TaxID=472 RepID=UPI0028ADA53E|nr:P-loop NTPase fold protein [Acinetobacter sp.]